MVTFLGALATLIIGYLVYGALVDRVFGRTGETAPAVRLEDGVDYIPLPTWKVFLIQLLNIAGPVIKTTPTRTSRTMENTRIT